jgi:carboxyl-terminal processing protease
MASPRPVLLALCAGLWACASPPADDKAGKQKPPAEAPEEPDVDLRTLLRLDERPFPLTTWTAHVISEEYFDKTRLDPRGQLVSALTHLGLHTPEFFATVTGDTATVTVGDVHREFPLADATTLAAAADRLAEILTFTQAELKLDNDATHKLEHAAINGLLAPLDPHTILLNPDEHTDLGIKTKGQFGGIGAEIREDERRIRIMKVIPGSPADKGGLKSGDLLHQIDKQSTVNLRAADAQQLLRGPIDSQVVLKVRRGEQTLTLTLTRQIIRVESVTAERLPGQIAYLRLLTFQENTGEQVRKALTDMKFEQDGPRGLIIDLRENTGGLLTQAVEVLDDLVSEGELVIVRSALGRESEVAKPTLALPAAASVVVLVNEESASASEIVAGSLKFLQRGVILGRTSFGKGTVQLVKPENFYGRELALKLTIAEYLVAGDRQVQTAGVQPDLALFPVELTAIPGVANYYDRERFERRREYAQVEHLPSAKHEKPPSTTAQDALQLRYLASRPGGSGVARPSEGPEALREPEVRIAHQVAEALTGLTDPAARQAKLAAVARDLALAEDTAIAAGIGALKIDWAGRVDGRDTPTLELAAAVLEKGEIRAGQPFTLHVEISNKGSAPVERVHAITDCPRDELDGIEILLGRLDPGQTLSRDVRLQVMGWHTSFTDTIKVDVHAGEPDPTPDASTTVRLDVSGLTRPHLALDWWIVDDPALVAAAPPRPRSTPTPGETPFAVRGNGDGNLQPGEQVLLAIEVGNLGPGNTTDARALVHNLSGTLALLEEGFVQLGPVAVNGKARGSFGMTVNPSADSKAPINLDIVVADVQLRESVRHKFAISLTPAGPAYAPQPAKRRVGGEPARMYNGASNTSRQLGEVAAGARLDILGTVGGWSALNAEPGRRAWLPSDLLQPADGKAPGELPVRTFRLIEPPALTIEPVEQVTREPTIEIRGAARHPVRVHDVLVTVKPPGVGQVEQKVDYEANKTRQGDQAKQMGFTARVPLAPGSNQILITARDGEDVEATREVWVFRADGGNLGPAF